MHKVDVPQGLHRWLGWLDDWMIGWLDDVGMIGGIICINIFMCFSLQDEINREYSIDCKDTTHRACADSHTLTTKASSITP